MIWHLVLEVKCWNFFDLNEISCEEVISDFFGLEVSFIKKSFPLKYLEKIILDFPVSSRKILFYHLILIGFK